MKNYNDLLEEAKKLNTVDEKVSLIFKYLLGRVEYNYAAMFKSRLFEDIYDLLDSYSELDFGSQVIDEKQKACDFLELKAREVAEETIQNQDLLNKEMYHFLYSLSLTTEKKDFVKMLGEASATLNKAVYQDGLLVRGDSFDIVDFMYEYFKDLGIKVVRVSGNAGIPHEWLIVYYGAQPYHLDPASAIFIRDGYTKINGRQTDYMKMTNIDLFTNDPNREITIVGRNLLAEPIDKENYIRPYDEREENTRH